MMRRTGIWLLILTLTILYGIGAVGYPARAQDPHSAKITSPKAGPSLTAIIQQPPTSTLRSAIVPTVLATLAPVSGDTGSTSPLPVLAPLDSFQTAFCNGVYIAIGLFIVFGIYSVIHARLRPTIRRMVNQLRDDGE